jgi:hypothetical protein
MHAHHGSQSLSRSFQLFKSMSQRSSSSNTLQNQTFKNTALVTSVGVGEEMGRWRTNLQTENMLDV